MGIPFLNRGGIKAQLPLFFGLRVCLGWSLRRRSDEFAGRKFLAGKTRVGKGAGPGRKRVSSPGLPPGSGPAPQGDARESSPLRPRSSAQRPATGRGRVGSLGDGQAPGEWRSGLGRRLQVPRVAEGENRGRSNTPGVTSRKGRRACPFRHGARIHDRRLRGDRASQAGGSRVLSVPERIVFDRRGRMDRGDPRT